VPNYGTVDGVLELYSALKSVTTLTSVNIESFINRAEADVHASIAGRYTVPVAGSPPLLKDITETLATARILRRFFSQQKENASEWVEGWLTDARDRLTALAAGSLYLVTSAGVTLIGDRETLTPWSSTEKYVPTWAAALGAEDAVIDPDRVQDERDNRLP